MVAFIGEGWILNRMWRIFLTVFFAIFMTGITCFATSPPIKQTTVPLIQTDPVIHELSIDAKRAFRKEYIKELMAKYEQNHTLAGMRQYLILKYQELKIGKAPRDPQLVIQETLDKARSMYERTQPYVGNSFKRMYNPEQIEITVHRYLWLKGFCFFFMGIGTEHKVAFSYFYLPGNENIKHQLMRDVVHYSFPEVLDVPENASWFERMSGVMDRLGYDIFSVAKYCKNAVPPVVPTPDPAGTGLRETSQETSPKPSAETSDAPSSPLPSSAPMQ